MVYLQEPDASRYRVYLLAPDLADIDEWRRRGLDAVPLRPDNLSAGFFDAPDGLVVDLRGLHQSDVDRCWRIHDTLGIPLFAIAPQIDSVEVVELLRRGAADVVVESASPALVAARVSAFLRRSHGHGHGPGELTHSVRFGDIEVDLENRRVRSFLGNSALCRSEFNLLLALLRADGRTCSNAELTTLVSESGHHVPSSSMRVTVARLRKKLGDDSARPRIILTTRGVGYRLAMPAAQPPSLLKQPPPLTQDSVVGSRPNAG